jgi:aspartate/glutamate racemase
MIRLTCLHTASSNIAIFDDALTSLSVGEIELTHEVRADLLAQAEADGGLTAGLQLHVADILGHLRRQCDGVVLTCSTLGPVAETLAEPDQAPVMRTDLALAQASCAEGRRVAVLCTAPTTLEVTGGLFRKIADQTTAKVEIILVTDAWAAFKAGALERYFQLIADAATAQAAQGFDTIALAQASMAPAAALIAPSIRVLTSPISGLEATIAAARQYRAGIKL